MNTTETAAAHYFTITPADADGSRSIYLLAPVIEHKLLAQLNEARPDDAANQERATRHAGELVGTIYRTEDGRWAFVKRLIKGQRVKSCRNRGKAVRRAHWWLRTALAVALPA